MNSLKFITSDNFIYWLQGFFELSEAKALTKAQVKMIQDHLIISEKKNPYLHWLDGFLAAQKEDVSEDDTKLIVTKLQESFNNVTKSGLGNLEYPIIKRPLGELITC